MQHHINQLSENPIIPEDINSFGIQKTASLYRSLGFAPHPVRPPSQGKGGKNPILKGWRTHKPSDVDEAFLEKHFGAESKANIGCVVAGSHIVVDLDSKKDCGESVLEWAANKPSLVDIPQERTAGGLHIHYVCHDIPKWVLESNKALVATISDEITAELYFEGLNIIMTPSLHHSGVQYRWQVTGTVREIRWNALCKTFGFPLEQPAQSKKKNQEWLKARLEDLRSLDLVAMAEELEWGTNSLDPDDGKFSIRCPWEDEHSEPYSQFPGASTVIFNKPGRLPAFKCLHAHCSSRKLQQLLEHADELKPGIVAAHCSRNRFDAPDTSADGKPQIVLPGIGRPQSEFGSDLGEAIGNASEIFIYNSQIVVVNYATPGGDEESTASLAPLSAIQLITQVERFVQTGVIKKEEDDFVFKPVSMSIDCARITMENECFKTRLPKLRRLLHCPIPHSIDGEILYPIPGYDPRFGTYLCEDAPSIHHIELEEAKHLILNDLLGTPKNGGFFWANEQALAHAVARLITPFCRGIMKWKRPPVFIYVGNREGCGKDTCASLAFMIYMGRAVISAPLAKGSDDEMRKRITSAMMSGHQSYHFANMKGHLDFAALEAATDNSGYFEDRILGSSTSITLRNEMEYSISANNATWTADIERRCRTIHLHYTQEDVNRHQYKHHDILGYCLKNRERLLSAFAALLGEWVRQGCPPGPTPFTSFPEWGRVVGGILTCCGLPDPCLPHLDTRNSGDQTTQSVRSFFELAFEYFDGETANKAEFQQFIVGSESVQDLFEWIDFEKKSGRVAFGKLIKKFNNRELGGITMVIKQTSKNCMTYEFFRAETPDEPLKFQPVTDQDVEEGGGEQQGGFRLRLSEQGLSFSGKTGVANTSLAQARRKVSLHVPASLKFELSKTRGDLELIASSLEQADRIALDIETYGPGKGDALDPWKGEIRLLTLYGGSGTVWILDLMEIGYDLGSLKPILERAEILAHNAKFDLLWLLVKCGIRVQNVSCTMTASRLLAAGTIPGHGLEKCLKRHLGVAPTPDLSLSEWGNATLSPAQLEYSMLDVAYLHELTDSLESQLLDSDLEIVWQFESVLLPDVVRMESNGMNVDAQRLKSAAALARAEAEEAEESLRRALNYPELNPSSPKQLLQALQKHGLPLTNTKEEALREADEGKLVPLVLAHRKSVKLAQDTEAMLTHVGKDGRIHAQFSPTGTVTGRFSSKQPNLQSVGHGPLREAFCAPPGRVLVVADYSQIELRIAAAVANEPKMLRAYRSDSDLHRLTAASVLGIEVDAVTDEQRQTAKAVNFGLLYGQKAEGLVRYAAKEYGVTLSLAEAEDIRKRFFETYAAIRTWHSSAWNWADSAQECRTRSARRRLIPADSGSWNRFSTLVNTPIQGGAADVMKLAIVILMGRLPETAMLVATVHDELIVECPESDAEALKDLMLSAMTESMDVFYPQVKTAVEIKACQTWAEK